MPNYNIFKFGLYGDSGVGKTNLVLRFTENIYPNGYKSYIATNFKTKHITMHGNTYQLRIWDSERQHPYIRPHMQANVHGAILCYDMTDDVSFNNLTNWITKIHKEQGKNIAIFLVGTKSDLTAEKKISYASAKEFSENNNLDGFMEVSAKTDTSVAQAFAVFTDYLIAQNLKKWGEIKQEIDQEILRLNSWHCLFRDGKDKAEALQSLKIYIEQRNPNCATDLSALIKEWKEKPAQIKNNGLKRNYGQIVHINRLNFLPADRDNKTKTEIMLDKIASYKLR